MNDNVSMSSFSEHNSLNGAKAVLQLNNTYAVENDGSSGIRKRRYNKYQITLDCIIIIKRT